MLDAKMINSTDKVAAEFKGAFQQHFEAIAEIAGVETGTTAQKLDAYKLDVAVIDARGKALGDDLVENAMLAAVNERYASPTRILSQPKVFSDYVKRFHESKRVNVGQNGAVSGATMGQSVNDIQTQFGKIEVVNDIFFDQRPGVLVGKAQTSPQAPSVPVADGVAPTAVVTDTSTLFTDGAGSYLYAVAARNRFGTSAVVAVGTAQAVTATQAVNVSFTDGGGSYPAETFIIYRTKKDDVTGTPKFYPIIEVSTAERTGGYDGGAAGLVRDRNRILPETSSAMVYEPIPDIMKYVELMPTSRMDWALVAPSYRFSVLNYGTPQLSMPGKIVRIVNIGSDLT
jgi:hypothetical protein